MVGCEVLLIFHAHAKVAFGWKIKDIKSFLIESEFLDLSFVSIDDELVFVKRAGINITSWLPFQTVNFVLAVKCLIFVDEDVWGQDLLFVGFFVFWEVTLLGIGLFCCFGLGY